MTRKKVQNQGISAEALPGAKKPASHHDIFFKSFYSDPGLAFELFQLVLTGEELKTFDWSGLRLEKDTLKGNRRADMVFSVPLKQDPGMALRIFLLLEHKSKYHISLFTQLLVYQTLIHEQTIREGGRPLPVLPVVFYHGPRPWGAGLSFQEAYWGDFFNKIPLSSRKSMLEYRVRLLDIQDAKWGYVFEDEGFKSRGVLRLLKDIWTLKGDVASLRGALRLFRGFVGGGQDWALSVVHYLESCLGVGRKVWEQVERGAIDDGLFKKGGIMNIREVIKEEARLEGVKAGFQQGREKGLVQGHEKGVQQGMQQGLVQGVQQGLEQGVQQGLLDVALRMLQNDMDIKTICKITGMSEDRVLKLKQDFISS